MSSTVLQFSVDAFRPFIIDRLYTTGYECSIFLSVFVELFTAFVGIVLSPLIPSSWNLSCPQVTRILCFTIAAFHSSLL